MIIKKSERPAEIREHMRGGPGSVQINHCLHPEQLNKHCRLCAEIILPPGSGIGLHRHDNEDEIFIVQQGSGIITDDGTETAVTAGDVVLTGNGASHAVQNTGNTDLVMTGIIITY